MTRAGAVAHTRDEWSTMQADAAPDRSEELAGAIDHLRALNDAATPGPWEQLGGTIRTPWPACDGIEVASCALWLGSDAAHANAALIVGARNALPEILKRAEELQAACRFALDWMEWQALGAEEEEAEVMEQLAAALVGGRR